MLEAILHFFVFLQISKCSKVVSSKCFWFFVLLLSARILFCVTSLQMQPSWVIAVQEIVPLLWFRWRGYAIKSAGYSKPLEHGGDSKQIDGDIADDAGLFSRLLISWILCKQNWHGCESFQRPMAQTWQNQWQRFQLQKWQSMLKQERVMGFVGNEF